MAVLSSCQGESHSSPHVTNGESESGFPYVVRIVMDGGGSCTGSFLTDSILLTAAHCVDDADEVAYGSVKAPRSAFRINPLWPVDRSSTLPRLPKNDLALVQFPGGTYTGSSVATFSPRSPEVGEALKIVGYGNNRIYPFGEYCRLQKASEDGKCLLERGEQVAGSNYDYEKVFDFDSPTPEIDGRVCTKTLLKEALSETDETFEQYIDAHCGGNYRDRPYKETGSGKKRSGTNVVSDVSNGTIKFQGSLGGSASGEDSASGAGDSGGPLFVKISGKWQLAGITHGGSLVDRDEDLGKRSIYLDLNSDMSSHWLKENLNDLATD
jgi:hypothetical protein